MYCVFKAILLVRMRIHVISKPSQPDRNGEHASQNIKTYFQIKNSLSSSLYRILTSNGCNREISDFSKAKINRK